MNTRGFHLIVTLLSVVMFLFVPIAVGQTTYTFQPTSGTWDVATNWNPTDGPPAAADTAIIPAGRHCKVELADESAKIIQVSGTLGIIGHRLSLGSTTANSTSNIGGTLYFKSALGNDGYIEIKETVTFTGSGLMTARQAEGYGGGHIVDFYYEGFNNPSVVISGSLVTAGTLEILVDLEHNGTLKVDGSQDVFTLGAELASVPDQLISGTGEFQVSAGELTVKTVKFADTTPLWRITGGTFHLTDIPTVSKFLNLKVKVVMEGSSPGGTLKVDEDFSTTGDLTYKQGTIKVKGSRSAEFRQP